jgi:photosystem II stability/assembly factor-like uncharacterized protein
MNGVIGFRIVVIVMSIFVRVSFVFTQDWIQTPDVASVYVNDVIEHEGSLFAVTDSTVFRSTDGGTSWHPAEQQPASVRLHTLYSTSGSLYIGTRGDGIFQSRDGGGSWDEVNTGLAGHARDITECTVRGDSLFAGTDGSGIFVLNLNNPVQWTSFNSGLTQVGVSSITTSGTTLIAAAGSFLFVRPAGAASWSIASLDSVIIPLPFKVYPMDGYVFVGTSNGVYRGNANGTGWQKTDIAQFPGRNIVALTSFGNRIFAGLQYRGEHFIFSTDDYGASWDIRSHEFAPLVDMIVSHGRMWAARLDGLWSFEIGYWTGIDDPAEFLPETALLAQNYPNPFNPVTTISYRLSERSHVTLTVYDLLGKEVATLVTEDQQPGSYEVTFDGSGFASGVYVYRLKTGAFQQAKRFVLAK